MPVIDFTAAQGGILRINGFLRRGLSVRHGYGTGAALEPEGSVNVTEDDDVMVASGTYTNLATGILLETGDNLLLESGDLWLLEAANETKITALDEMTVPVGTDLVLVVDDVAGTPASQKMTLTTLLEYLVA